MKIWRNTDHFLTSLEKSLMLATLVTGDGALALFSVFKVRVLGADFGSHRRPAALSLRFTLSPQPSRPSYRFRICKY